MAMLTQPTTLRRLEGARPVLRTCGLVVPSMLLLLLLTTHVGAQTQYAGVCALVRMEIAQTLTIERIGFLATLRITNNVGDGDLTSLSAALTFEDPSLTTEEDGVDDSSNKFFVQPPTLSGVTGIAGDGIIPSGATAEITWFIIPKITAGGEVPTGIQYKVGVNLGMHIYGEPVPSEMTQVIPDVITVRPEPLLDIIYFQPKDVQGDNPFTMAIVEAPVPFTLGVLVRNVGFGKANNIAIASEQPEVVSNDQGLLMVAQLIGSRVDDDPTDYSSLTVNLGDIEPGECRKAAWDMITTLSGHFLSFDASFTHASELGGIETSVIQSIDAHFIAHEVRNDRPGQDLLLDFLADVDEDPAEIPDTLFTTNCDILPVNHLSDTTVSQAGFVVDVDLSATIEGWIYVRETDLLQDVVPIESVVRSDGKVLDPNNYWTNHQFDPYSNERLNYLSIFDYVGLADYTYTVTYLPPVADVIPPVTTIHFAGPFELVDDVYYLTRDTQIFFLVEDASPVGTYRRLDGSGLDPFLPAYPFKIADYGSHTLDYYSEDMAGNVEVTQTAVISISGAAPDFTDLTMGSSTLVQAGQGLSVRPDQVEVSFQANGSAGHVDAEVEIFRGVEAYPTVNGVPSSPTSLTEATLTVAGEHVDYYRYRIGGGAWSDEWPVATPIAMSGLSGLVAIEINGRSGHGAYLPEEQAIAATWTIGAAAPPEMIAADQETPTHSNDVSFTVSGVDEYKAQLDEGAFLVPTDATVPITYTDLDEGIHSVSIIGRNGTDDFPPIEEAVRLYFKVDRNYGAALSELVLVRQESYPDVGADPITFLWDGRDDLGVLQPAGWYTLRVSLSDGLGRTTQRTQLIEVGDLTGGGGLISDGGGAQQLNLVAAGGWAVWQDQRSGDWDIHARRVADPVSLPVVISQTTLNQENPNTDGISVVWEERRPDGGLDIWIKALDSPDPATAVTDSAEFDERDPAVYGSRVVYRARAAANPDAPWQLFVTDLSTSTTVAVDPTTQDQLDPAIHGRLIAWQDLRDPGAGDIYLKNLADGLVTRLTDDPNGQYHAAVNDRWVVWTDSRHSQLEIYGYSLAGDQVRRLTDTVENESRPTLSDGWVVYQEDSLGVLLDNIRALHLTSLSTVQLTNIASRKHTPSMTSGKLIWRDERNGPSEAMVGDVPNLMPVYDNAGLVTVTDGMATYLGDAYQLLTLWQQQVGVTRVTRYTELVPTPVAEVVEWVGGVPVGPNFTLTPGSFLWVEFTGDTVLDLGFDPCGPIDLNDGVNVLSYSCFPDNYTSFRVIDELGVTDVRAVRVLDSFEGTWRVTAVEDGDVVGDDFPIPRAAVLFIEALNPVTAWTPGS